MKNLLKSLCLLLVSGLFATGCPGSTSDESSEIKNKKFTGDYFMGTIGANDDTAEYWGDFIGVRSDGKGGAEVDSDLDGDYGDVDDGDDIKYRAYKDDSVNIAGKFIGLQNDSKDTIMAVDTDLDDDKEVMLMAGIKKGSGITNDDFDGLYLGTQIGVDTDDNSPVANLLVLDADSSGALGVSPAMDTYTLDASGRFTSTFNSDAEGMLRQDGEFLILSDTSTASSDDISLTLACKVGSGLDASALDGTYVFGIFGGIDGSTPSYWTTRGEVDFDGDAVAIVTISEDSDGDPGVEVGAYTVLADGELLITLTDNDPLLGTVCNDGEMFIAVDTDDGDDAVMMIFGIKK